MQTIQRSLKHLLEVERFFGIEEIIAARPGKNKKARQMEELSHGIKSCRKCRLYTGIKNYVVGEGSLDAKVMFVGEAPGYEEDIQGRPFVGAAGQLLDKIIAAMGFMRKDVYIANCLKCRPPHNRNPEEDELLHCEPYLVEQIKIIAPQVICALGKFAGQNLLKTKLPITRLRGKFAQFQGIAVMPTFHPAYLLRNPADKKLVWEDIKSIKKYIDNGLKRDD